MTAPTEIKIGRRISGVAGQYAYNVTVTYEGHRPYEARFVGNIYGGPIACGSYWIDRSVVERCGGKLSPQFIRNFYKEG